MVRALGHALGMTLDTYSSLLNNSMVHGMEVLCLYRDGLVLSVMWFDPSDVQISRRFGAMNKHGLETFEQHNLRKISYIVSG
jgi:hypothetical protein